MFVVVIILLASRAYSLHVASSPFSAKGAPEIKALGFDIQGYDADDVDAEVDPSIDVAALDAF